MAKLSTLHVGLYLGYGHTIPDSSNTVVVRSLIAADLSFEFLSLIDCQLLYVSIWYCMLGVVNGQIWDLPTHWFLCFKTQEIVAQHILKGLCHAICYLFCKQNVSLVLNSHSNLHWICIKFQHFNFVIYIYIIYNKVLYIYYLDFETLLFPVVCCYTT